MFQFGNLFILIIFLGKIIWIREESLASIVAVEMIELPISDSDAAIDKEFDHKECKLIFDFFSPMNYVFHKEKSMRLYSA